MDQSGSLAVLDHAKSEIERITSVDDAKTIRDQAEALRIYAKKAGKGLGVQNRAAEIKIRAERRAGQILIQMNLHKGGRPTKTPPIMGGVSQSLREAGITWNQSSRWQAMAQIPCEIFETEIGAFAGQLRELTSAFFAKLAHKLSVEGKTEEYKALPSDTCEIEDLIALIEGGKTFGTVYVDPPWKYGNQATRAATSDHYKTLTVSEIGAWPVDRLAAQDSHLHLWTTNAFLREALDLIGHWGFEYKGCMLWVKPQMGIGNYWRVSHEFLLLGTKGHCPFLDRGQMSWIQVERSEHSKKPDVFRQTIEKVSPGPRIELFAREVHHGWTCHGNEIKRNLFTATVPVPETLSG